MGNNPSQAWPPSWIKIRPTAIPEQSGKQEDQASFKSYLQTPDRLPKIYRSFVDTSKLQNWDAEGLSKILGDASVEVYVSTSGNFPGGHGSIYDGKERKKVVMKAKDALERIRHTGDHQPVLASGERYYIYQYDAKPFAPLIDQIPNSPSMLVPEPNVFTNVWISSADSLTPAHYDKADNLLLQLQGRKSFLIWDPAQLANLSLQPETADQDRQTTINMRDQNSVKAHPNFLNNASAYHCILNPGDVLYMPEGWIHAVYSMDTSASVNFWWNQPTATATPMETDTTITLHDSFELEGPYDKVHRPKIAPIPIPFGVVLAKRFNTRENELQGWFRDENAPIIPCQACASSAHEYDKCPYLGHYQYKRISGQSCDYSDYTLVETAPEQPTLTLSDVSDIFSATKKYRPINKPLVPIPNGVTLATNFNNRDNVLKSQSNVMRAHIDCQACGSTTHEVGDCPYLGYYETIHIMGQACDYSGYQLRNISAPTSNSNTAVAPPTLAPSLSDQILASLQSRLFSPVPQLAKIIPEGLKLTKEFTSRNTTLAMRSDAPKPPCQACNDEGHGYKDCPYLGHYQTKIISGQVGDYEVYALQEHAQ